jgi:hypothetical protein
MPKPASSFNPARFNDQLDETWYAGNWGPGLGLKHERKERVEELRKKKDDKPSLALADKLESCKPNTRCKSPACPECSYAGQELGTDVTLNFLKARPSAETIVCVSVVPADGTTKPRKLPGELTKETPSDR